MRTKVRIKSIIKSIKKIGTDIGRPCLSVIMADPRENAQELALSDCVLALHDFQNISSMPIVFEGIEPLNYLKQLMKMVPLINKMCSATVLETSGEKLQKVMIPLFTEIIITPPQFTPEGWPMSVNYDFAFHENVHYCFKIDGARAYDYLKKLKPLINDRRRNPLFLRPDGISMRSLLSIYHDDPIPNILIVS